MHYELICYFEAIDDIINVGVVLFFDLKRGSQF